MKKAIIVGAGIAGLTCGIYAAKNGFDTEIYEAHTGPGGECTGWDRKGYHFDGCIHWLVGSKPGTSFHKIWRDTGAIDDTVKFINHDIYVRYEEEGASVTFYTDAGRLEKHLTEIAPEDKRQIKRLCGAIRALGDLNMPIDKPMDMMTAGDGIRFAAKNFAGIKKMSEYGKMKVKDLAGLFKSPLLKRALLAIFDGEYTAMAFVSTLAGMNAGDCGYPLGGSRALASRMEKRFLDSGGKIFYGSAVDEVLVENAKAVGVKLKNGKEILSDYVVSCADGYATLKNMLGDRYTPPLYKKLFGNPKEYPPVTSALVFMGVDADIPFDCRGVDMRRGKPVSLSGVVSEHVTLLNYGYDRSMAPAGKSVFVSFYGADYDFWNSIYPDKEKYAAEKKRLEEDAVAALVRRYPEAEGKVEVTDVVTPMTYERYCNAWRGAWMTWTCGEKEVPRYFNGVLPGLENFIMAGMWTMPPGGLPGAAAAGRFAAHRLCIWNGIPFKTE